MHAKFNYSQNCLNRTQNKSESCKNQTSNEVPMYEIFINLTCINQKLVYSERKSWSEGVLHRFNCIHSCIFRNACYLILTTNFLCLVQSEKIKGDSTSSLGIIIGIALALLILVVLLILYICIRKKGK